jgi:hypothetical protein
VKPGVKAGQNRGLTTEQTNGTKACTGTTSWEQASSEGLLSWFKHFVERFGGDRDGSRISRDSNLVGTKHRARYARALDQRKKSRIMATDAASHVVTLQGTNTSRRPVSETAKEWRLGPLVG